jgi:hypothetical protein
LDVVLKFTLEKTNSLIKYHDVTLWLQSLIGQSSRAIVLLANITPQQSDSTSVDSCRCWQDQPPNIPLDTGSSVTMKYFAAVLVFMAAALAQAQGNRAVRSALTRPWKTSVSVRSCR